MRGNLPRAADVYAIWCIASVGLGGDRLPSARARLAGGTRNYCMTRGRHLRLVGTIALRPRI